MKYTFCERAGAAVYSICSQVALDGGRVRDSPIVTSWGGGSFEPILLLLVLDHL